MPGFFVAVIYPQNGDLTKLLKSARKKVPQSARLSAGRGVQKLKGQCPNAQDMNLSGASLNCLFVLRTYSRPNHVLLLLPPNLLWLLTTLAVVTSSNYSLIKVGIKPKLGDKLAKVGIGFELGHRQCFAMLSLLT